MKIGQIKIEALRLMFLPVGNLSPESLGEMEGDRMIGTYLEGMHGSINRALGDLEMRRVLPLCRRVIEYTEWEKDGAFLSMPHSRIEGLFEIARLYRTDAAGRASEVSVGMEGERLVAVGPEEGERTVLLYRKRLSRVEPWENEEELEGVPEGIASLIPYFIKGELYREDDSGEAAAARNFYETSLARLSVMNEERMADAPVRVHAVYSQTEV